MYPPYCSNSPKFAALHRERPVFLLTRDEYFHRSSLDHATPGSRGLVPGESSFVRIPVRPNKRCQSDSHLLALIAEQGVGGREAKEYAQNLKSLQLAHDVVLSFLKGAQRHTSYAMKEKIGKMMEGLESNNRDKQDAGGESGSEDTREQDALQEWKKSN